MDDKTILSHGRVRPIMIQGTSSLAGKSTLVAGLCRMFADRGIRTAPFKSQNMSHNSYVTADGEEIARATAVQAFGARQAPIVHMNPLLLKPKSDDTCQLIVHGKAVRDVSSKEYFCSSGLQALKLHAIDESLAYLNQHFDLIVAEGAGSCAEPNLRALDVVNMGLAHRLGARVFVLADVDKGGAFADMVGSLRIMELTAPEDLELIEGFIINKFRGDRDVLQPAIDFVTRHTGVPVVGVLPFIHNLTLEEEDRIRQYPCENPEIDVAVVYLPHTSNANDLDFLAREQNVRVRFVKSADGLGVPDLIVLPGTKNTTWDLEYLRRTGLERQIRERANDTPVVGICGGFQMLGRRLLDPRCTESELGSIDGMGLLDFEVEFSSTKIVRQGTFAPAPHNLFASAGLVTGYEIHSGVVRYGKCHPLYARDGEAEGAIDAARLIMGTMVHDIFRNAEFTRALVNRLREIKGLDELSGPLPDHEGAAEESYDRLAQLCERELGRLFGLYSTSCRGG